jgi:hypothetical protein
MFTLMMLEVQLIDAPLTSASDYYPYGLPICYRSYSSEHYRYGYQGQFAEKDEETGWNAFELRMYEPVYFFSSESSKGDSESMLKRIQRQGA